MEQLVPFVCHVQQLRMRPQHFQEIPQNGLLSINKTKTKTKTNKANKTTKQQNIETLKAFFNMICQQMSLKIRKTVRAKNLRKINGRRLYFAYSERIQLIFY